MANAKETNEIKYKVSERYPLCEGEKGWNLELRKLSWLASSSNEEKWDMRKWKSVAEDVDAKIESEEEMTVGTDEKMGKGICFNDEEFMAIAKFFQAIEIETEEENDNPDGDEED